MMTHRDSQCLVFCSLASLLTMSPIRERLICRPGLEGIKVSTFIILSYCVQMILPKEGVLVFHQYVRGSIAGFNRLLLPYL